MGRKLDALLGRKGFKTARFKSLLGMAVSRIAVLKNKHNIRCTQARNDVAQLLNMAGQQEQALLRVEHVIKEQNMLDVFLVVEGYCNLLIERVTLIENSKGECPDELREAITSVIFAASRCGEFPELQEIRHIFMSRFGKEFTDSAVELRNNCGVNPKMIQKLSTRQPSIESRRKVLKEIALENGITLNLDEACENMVEEINLNQRQNQHKPKISEDVRGNGESSVKSRPEDNTRTLPELGRDEQFSNSMKTKKYADVASAAQAAFESAAYAAAAARAAVELSRSEPQDKGSDDQSSPSTRKRWDEGSSRSRPRIGERRGAGIAAESGGISGFEKFHPVQNSSSESERELLVKSNKILSEKFRGKHIPQLERSASASSSDSIEVVTLEETKMPSNESKWTKPLEKAIVFDESDDETEKEQGKIFAFKRSEQRKFGVRTGDRFPKNSQFSAFSVDEFSDKNEGSKLHYPSQKQNQRQQHQQNQKEGMGPGIEDIFATYYADGRSQAVNNAHLGSTERERLRAEHSNVEKKPASVRTRRGL